MNDTAHTSTTVAVDPSLVSWTKLIYALHAASIIIGVASTAFIITAFVFGLPSIIAVIMNYVKRDQVKGTWLESHFRWQIRTFWIACAWLIGITLVFGPLSLILIGIPFLFLGYILTGIWVAYRVVKGWMTLADGKPIPSGGS
jgi:uncharacterized membrane protein